MLSIHRSGYYAWLKRPKSCRQQKNEALDKKIQEVFKRHQGRYGAPRLTDELKKRAVEIE
jgi:putative transposase